MIITIDGKQCECEQGEFLLQIAARNGIRIPTLCHHEGLPGQGCCRVCVCEVVENGWSKIVVSCVYPVGRECEVFTSSEKVQKQRAMTLRLLQLRAPESKTIAGMCKAYGAPDTPTLQPLRDGDKCILCGLCVKGCNELGAGAISTANRGITKEIATPYDEPSADCIGCGSCAQVCPTKAIDMVETANTRTIWGREFDLLHCEQCGALVGTREEVAYAAKKAGVESGTLCAECRKKSMADVIAHTYGT